MNTGLWVGLAAVLISLLFGFWRRASDGRVKPETTQRQETLTAAELGAELGQQQTFVQFSSEVCAACRSTARLLSQVSAAESGVAHLEILAEEHLELVDRLDIRRTPTVLVLDEQGVVRQRIVGGIKRAEEIESLVSAY